MGSGCIRCTIERARSADHSPWGGAPRAARWSPALFGCPRRTARPKVPPMTSLSPEPAGLARKALLLVDDHPILRRGLTALIASEPGLAVHTTVGTRVSALAASRDDQRHLTIVAI